MTKTIQRKQNIMKNKKTKNTALVKATPARERLDNGALAGRTNRRLGPAILSDLPKPRRRPEDWPALGREEVNEIFLATPRSDRYIFSLKDSGHIANMLKDDGAEALADWLPRLIVLDTIHIFSLYSLSVLSETRAGLSLGMKKLDTAQADILSRHRNHLMLLDLRSLSEDCAESLSEVQGELWLAGVQPTGPMGSILSRHIGHLALDVEYIPDAFGVGLSDHRGGLSLKEARSIGVEAAACLADSSDDLYFGCLDGFDDDAIKALFDHVGRITITKPSARSKVEPLLENHRGQVECGYSKSFEMHWHFNGDGNASN